jgi:hypothetical protein
MPQPINDYLVGDDYAPKVPKPSLQQYDNYQIHRMYCIDRNYPSIPQLTRSSITTINEPLSNWIAYELTNNEGSIPINFGSFVEQYP